LPDNKQNQEPGGEELSKVEELEALLAEKNSRIAKLEQAMADKDKQIAALKQAAAEMEPKLAELEDSLAQAVSSYRALVVQANPSVPEELITGDSIEAIDNSVAAAQTLVEKVRRELEAEIAGAKIPAGAPLRTPLDLSALSPQEKIQYAIGERR
jgi:uncharacterized coiled-coil protein SlyX